MCSRGQKILQLALNATENIKSSRFEINAENIDNIPILFDDGLESNNDPDNLSDLKNAKKVPVGTYVILEMN